MARTKCFYVVEFLWPGEGWWQYIEATKRVALERGKMLEKEGFKRVKTDIPEKMEYTIRAYLSWYHGA